jgi:predicted RNA binding protein YcfA (HicA-like mRNA interferase family)
LASPSGSGSITIALESETTQLDEVVVKPEVPIARRIFNNIQEHKRSNRRHIQGLQDYQRLISTSVFLAVDTASGLQRLSHDLNDITIASGEERVRFSPVYLLEEAERVTPAGHETLMRRKESIFPRIDPAIEGYVLQNVVIELDFYQEQLPLFERGYISPIASSAPLYYDYYFNDSTQVGDSWHYHLSFVPKNRFHPLFTGNFWVEGDTWALTSVDAYISRDVNLNFVNGFSVATHYARRPEGFWFPETQNVRMNMSLTANTDSSGVYGAQRVDQLASGNWLVSKTLQYAVSERLADLKPELWKEAPEFGLPAIEEEAYLKVDRIRDIRVVRAVDAVGGMALTGYLNLGKVDLGPVFDIYTSNLVEGHRFGLPLRTSEKLWPHFSLGGFVAYGTRSEQVKYGGNLVWQPGESDRFILRAGFSDDYVLLAQDKYLRFIKNNPNDRGTSNFIGLFTAREKNPNLKEVQTAELRLEYNSDKQYPVVVSEFIEQAKEIEVDAVANKGEVVAYAISEHIEFAGVHSGDATIVFPPQKLYVETIRRVKRISRQIAAALNISGPFNMQLLAKDNDIKVIECNLRASRSFPFASKVLKVNLIDMATRVMLDLPVEKPGKSLFELDYVGIKAPQFSFARLQQADPVLGVDMASTGEVGCIGENYYDAVLQAMLSVGYRIPKKSVLISSGPLRDKIELLGSARMLEQKGYKLFATEGTHRFFAENGVATTLLHWPDQPDLQPNTMDYIREKKIDLVVNIPKNLSKGELRNGYQIRRSSVDFNIPLITNARLASAFIASFCKMGMDDISIKSWDEYK